jgi:hypothetical protein
LDDLSDRHFVRDTLGELWDEILKARVGMIRSEAGLAGGR